MDKHHDILKSIQRQEKWRQKQINILYKTGRPIFFNWEQKLKSPIYPNFLLKENKNITFLLDNNRE